MRRKRNLIAGALALIMALCLILPVRADDAWESEVSLSVTYGQTEARSMLDMINAFRTGDEAFYLDTDDTTHVDSKGQPLTYSYALEEVAMQRAAEIALSFSHTRPDGSASSTARGSDNSASYWGENIAAGNATASATFTQWREDDRGYSGQGHRRNMLSTDFKAVGIGHVTLGGTHYWVQEFSDQTDNGPESAAVDTEQAVTIKIASSQAQSVGDLSASPDNLSVAAGAEADAPVVSASVKLVDAWPERETSVTVSLAWTGGDDSVFTVSGQKITGVAAGSATLTGAALGKSVSVPVTVTGGENPPPQTDNPVLALTKTPALAEEARFEGQIYKSSADIDPAAYRVAIYIQLDDGGDAYYKPYDGAALPSLSAVKAADGYTLGTFSLAAYTDGESSANDRNAKYVHLLILPAGENPTTDNYAAMREKALEVVTVTRTAEGATVSPQHEPKQVQSDTPGRDPGWTVSADKIMLDVGFHSDGSAIGSAISEAHIRKHLEKLVNFADAVRFYNCSANLRPAYEIAKELGLRVAATVYLTANDAANKAELDRAAELLNAGLASICAVGNETLENGVLTADQLVSYIAYLRGKVTVETAYLTTADTVQALLKDENKAVRDACDFLFMHDYPYLGGVDPDKQLAALVNDYNDLKAKNNNPNFKVYIGETGYPTAGETHGNAAASDTEAARYFAEVREWSLQNGVPVFVFAAFDESAKSGSEAEKHFGLCDSALRLKNAYGNLPAFHSVATRLYGNSLSLRGNIGINFYLTVADALKADPDAYVTLADKKFLVKDAPHGPIPDDPDGDYYVFTWTVPAKQMNTAVAFRLYNGNGIPALLLGQNGWDYTDGYYYSVIAYLRLVRNQYETGTLRELVDAMSDYGSLTQRYFKYSPSTAAAVSNAVGAVTAESFAPYQPAITVTPGSGVSYVGSNLTLESETTLRHVFQLDDGRSLDEYEVTLDGQRVTPTLSSDGYYVEIPDIVAKRLNESHPLTVTLKDGGDALKIENYSALSYGWKALHGSTSDAALQNLVRGLYLYNQKAQAYFTES